MDTKRAYNYWAETYDKVENATRSLDEQVVREVLSDLNDKNIIEAGCGTGKNSVYFSEKGKSLIAFDFSKEMLSVARNKVPNDNARFLIHDITKHWPFENNSCDLVSINLILEHIRNIDFVFGEALRILRPKGELFVCELHPMKQEKGTVARFTDTISQKEIRLNSYSHSKLDFENAAKISGFGKYVFQNWFDETNKEIPRLLSILLTK